MHAPDDLRYTNDDLWADAQGRLGVTDFAQDQLGEVVYLELPAYGTRLSIGQSFGVIESAKAVIDLVSPLSGQVVERNDAAIDTPDLINASPYDDGWLIRVDVTAASDALMSARDYAATRPQDD